MRFLHHLPELLLLHGLSVAAQTQGDPDCPDGIHVVEVQPEVVVGLQPVYISTFIPSNTVLTIGGTTIPITNAPTTLVTSFTLTGTSTRFSTGDPEPLFTGYYTTITSDGPGSRPTTITQAPSGQDPTGTVIVVNPTNSLGNTFNGPYTTLTSTGAGGSQPSTLTLPPLAQMAPEPSLLYAPRAL
ncbi:hypothetical protein NW754_015406 [Fusarium falciforme]|nr:hypothetical protein NW754_015406 [Fusarium falciforme]